MKVANVLRKKKLNCKTYHLQEVCFSKVLSVRNINESFPNPHLPLILTNQCLTNMAGSGTVINVFSLPYDDIASCPRRPSAADKMWLQQVSMRTSRCKYNANRLYCTYFCCCGAEEDQCRILPVSNMLMTFERLFSFGFSHFFNHTYKKA